MISAEQLIADLNKAAAKLTEDLAIAEQNVKDFERLAQTWKESYEKLDAKYKRDMGNAQVAMDELRAEIETVKCLARERSH